MSETQAVEEVRDETMLVPDRIEMLLQAREEERRRLEVFHIPKLVEDWVIAKMEEDGLHKGDMILIPSTGKKVKIVRGIRLSVKKVEYYLEAEDLETGSRLFPRLNQIALLPTQERT